MTDQKDAAPACPAPPAVQPAPIRCAMPPGAVDTHAHVIGGSAAYPLVTPRSYTPPAATPAQYLAMLDAVGLTSGVLVQISVHGQDNSLLLDTLRAHPRRLRGVAVAAPDLPEARYAEMHAAGVRGLRINVLFRGGGVGYEDISRYGALARELGWHLQFLLDARELPALGPTLDRLQVPVVFDHMGHLPAACGVADPGFQTLLARVRDGAWVKLSGAYRLSDRAPDYGDTVPLARALADAAPDRCVWGSDWPHVANWRAMPTVGSLLDLLVDWVPDADARRRILADNAQALYGFDTGKDRAPAA